MIDRKSVFESNHKQAIKDIMVAISTSNSRTEIKGRLALNHDEFCALYTALEQLLYYKDDKPSSQSGYIQMGCALSQEEIKSIMAIFERLGKM